MKNYEKIALSFLGGFVCGGAALLYAQSKLEANGTSKPAENKESADDESTTTKQKLISKIDNILEGEFFRNLDQKGEAELNALLEELQIQLNKDENRK